jgi:RimJ/RimL family protein N-acetyltransferase
MGVFVNNRWAFPSTDIILENNRIKITSVNIHQDLESLFSAGSIQANAEDLFKYHVNIPPMDSIAIFEGYMQSKLSLPTEVMYKIFSKRLNKLVGCVSLMNVRADHGVIEVGSIWYSKVAQKTEINTNAMLLLFTYVFEDLKYRRLEWKCNNNNLDSKRAAIRLGFEYEGLFRQHMMSRGENRDTAWFSMIDKEWAEKKKNLQAKAGKEF